jgi:hypothetical protein
LQLSTQLASSSSGRSQQGIVVVVIVVVWHLALRTALLVG